MKNFQRSKTSVVSFRDLEIHDSRNVKLCESPSRAGGLLTINQYSLVSAFLVQIVLLIKSVWLFRERINPDAIVYLRIAGYYLNGQTDLLVAGGWGRCSLGS